MIPTQDPAYTATRLLRIANKAKKPVRIFLGVSRRGGKDRILIATDDGADLVQAAVREEIQVHPDAHPDTLAAAITAIFSRLRPQVLPSYSTGPREQHRRFNPGRRA